MPKTRPTRALAGAVPFGRSDNVGLFRKSGQPLRRTGGIRAARESFVGIDMNPPLSRPQFEFFPVLRIHRNVLRSSLRTSFLSKRLTRCLAMYTEATLAFNVCATSRTESFCKTCRSNPGGRTEPLPDSRGGVFCIFLQVTARLLRITQCGYVSFVTVGERIEAQADYVSQPLGAEEDRLCSMASGEYECGTVVDYRASASRGTHFIHWRAAISFATRAWIHGSLGDSRSQL